MLVHQRVSISLVSYSPYSNASNKGNPNKKQCIIHHNFAIVVGFYSPFWCCYMMVSKNSGTPKSSMSMVFSIMNHPSWGTRIETNIWRFPKMGLPPNHPNCTIWVLNYPTVTWGSPILRNPQTTTKNPWVSYDIPIKTIYPLVNIQFAIENGNW